MHVGELAAARFRLSTAATQFPGSLRILRLLADVTLRVGDPLAAEPVLRRILELDPTDTKAEEVIKGIERTQKPNASGA
jgi:hypothetical protein